MYFSILWFYFYPLESQNLYSLFIVLNSIWAYLTNNYWRPIFLTIDVFLGLIWQKIFSIFPYSLKTIFRRVESKTNILLEFLYWTTWSNIHLPLLPGNFGYFWKFEAKSINVTILINKKLLTFCCKSLITLKVNISYWKRVLYSYQPKTKIIRKIRINNLQTFPPQKKSL